MIKWERIGKTVRDNGEVDVIYESDDGRWRIESRKRAIPHSGRGGVWWHTSYWLIDEDGAEKEYPQLKWAKFGAEVKKLKEERDEAD